MDMDMDQVWSIFFINLFSALEALRGWKLLFLFLFFSLGWGEKVLNTGVGLVDSFLISRWMLLLLV